MDHYEPKDDKSDDNFIYAGDLYRLMSESQKQALIENTARNIDGVTKNVQLRHTAHCYNADKNYGERLAKALNLDLNETIELSKLSHSELMKATRPSS